MRRKQQRSSQQSPVPTRTLSFFLRRPLSRRPRPLCWPFGDRNATETKRRRLLLGQRRKIRREEKRGIDRINDGGRTVLVDEAVEAGAPRAAVEPEHEGVPGRVVLRLHQVVEEAPPVRLVHRHVPGVVLRRQPGAPETRHARHQRPRRRGAAAAGGGGHHRQQQQERGGGVAAGHCCGGGIVALGSSSIGEGSEGMAGTGTGARGRRVYIELRAQPRAVRDRRKRPAEAWSI
jgi:hypothetical protein